MGRRTNSRKQAKYVSHPERERRHKEYSAQKRANKPKQANCKKVVCSNIECKKEVKINNYGKKENIKQNSKVHKECTSLEMYLCAVCRGGDSITLKKGGKNAKKADNK